MPTYEYECTKCGHGFEEFASFSDPPRARCPRCRGKVRRLISAGAGIVFKGSGWYVTDSRAKPSAAKSADKPGDKPADKPAAATDQTGAKAAPASEPAKGAKGKGAKAA